MRVDIRPQREEEFLSARYLLAVDEEDKTPPRRTPGQAEGVDEESERSRPDSDGLRRKRPSQAEGEDDQDEADEVPPEE